MEFLKNHKQITNKEYKALQNLIITKLKTEFDKGRTAENAIKLLANNIYNDLIHPSFINRYLGYFQPCFDYLNNHTEYYNPEKTDSIENVLKDEVYMEYSKKKELAHKQEYIKEDFINLTYEKFVEHLLKYSVLKKINHRLESENEYFSELLELFYEMDNYSDFNISFLKDNSNLITYKRVNKIFIKNNKVLKIEDPDNKIQVTQNEENKFLLKYDNVVSLLTLNEKLLLIHILLTYYNKIDEPEKIKLILLTSGIKDYRIFEQISNKNLIYNKVTKWQKYSFSKNKKEEIISSTLEKIKICKLTTSSEILSSLLSKI